MPHAGSRSSRRWSLLLVKVRSRYDYAAYLLRNRRGYAWAAFLFLVSVAAFVASPLAGSLPLTALGIISFIGSVAGFVGLNRDLRHHTVEPAEVDYDSVVAPEGMELVSLRRHNSGNDYGFAATHEFLEASGVTTECPQEAVAQWSDRSYVLPRELRSVAAAVLYGHYRRTDAPHFNGVVVRQLSETGRTRRIGIGGCTYFDLLATNYLADKTVCDPDDNCVLDGRTWLTAPRSDGRSDLLTLERSRLANSIGVSTLAFTADSPRQLLLVRQAHASASSPGLWAPSASGSVDLNDVTDRRTGAETPVRDILTHAMERELVEESNIDRKDIEETRVLGYFRWLNKGAKPEYVGLTTLDVRASSLRVRPRVEERPWVRRVSTLDKIDFDALRDGHILAALPEELRGMAAREHAHLRDTTSFPLFMCLRYLGAALRRDKSLLASLTVG